MQNKSWKKELDLLSEAYSSINETSYKDDKSDALGQVNISVQKLVT